MYIIKEKFKDFNGTEREEEFYFNLTMSEVTQMELSEYGGMTEMLKTMVNKKDIPKMIRIFEELIDRSYGVKSADGRRFVKNEEVLTDFKQTNAYSQIFMKFATDSEFTAKFIKNVLPGDMEEQLKAIDDKVKTLSANGGITALV